MKIRITIEVPDHVRRALAKRDGLVTKLAPRDHVINEVDAVLDTHWQDIEDDADTDEGRSE